MYVVRGYYINSSLQIIVHSPSVMQHQAYDRSEREERGGRGGQKWQKWFKDEVHESVSENLNNYLALKLFHY